MSKVIEAFLSPRNMSLLRKGVPSQYINKHLPTFVKCMKRDLSESTRVVSVNESVIRYNRLFKQILYDDVASDMVVRTQNVGKLHRGNYNQSADSVLKTWEGSVARQVQDRSDRVSIYDDDSNDENCSDDDGTNDYDNVYMYGDGDPENFTDTNEYFTQNTRKHNKSGYGYSMTYDDEDDALKLQEEIFGSSDIGSHNGYFGVRSNANVRERKNHVREYDKKSGGVRGYEYEGAVGRRYDMSNVRKRY